MRTYARMIRRAIAEFDDPLERLAAGVIAAVRIAASHQSGVDRGLSRLRLQLGQVEPEIVARSQAPVTTVFHELIEEAAAAASFTMVRPEPATYLLSAVRTSFIMSTTLGNDYGVELPDAIELSSFCLGGLGACLPREWHDSVDTRLQLSGGDRSILPRLAAP